MSYKNILFFIILQLCIISFQQNNSVAADIPVTSHAITAHIVGDGRLGDGIYTYCLAKLFSYKYNIPFYFTPFEHSEAFSFEKTEKFIDSSTAKSFKHTVEILSEDDLITFLKTAQEPTLFTLGFGVKIYAPPVLTESIMWPDCYSSVYASLTQHPSLLYRIKKALTLKIAVPKIQLPQDKISIAIHIRKGSGPDRGQSCIQYLDEWNDIMAKGVKKPEFIRGHDITLPLKFPPEQFYVDQIKKLSLLFNNAPLYVYVFTDDHDAQALVARLQRRINLSNVTFDFLKEDNSQRHANKNAIFHDVSGMSQFDCLIRAESGLSWSIQLLGNPKVIVHPQCSMIQCEESLNQAYMEIWESTIIFNNPQTNCSRYLSFRDVTQEHWNYFKQVLPFFTCKAYLDSLR